MSETVLQSNLKRFRKYNGYTQQQISNYLGVTRQAYSHYEAGERVPNYVILAKLAEFYNISVDNLILPEEEYEEMKRAEQNSPYRYLPERERKLIEMMKELSENEQEDLFLYLKHKVAKYKSKEKKISKKSNSV